MRFLLRPWCWIRGHRLEFGSIYLLEPLDVDPGTGVETELSETEGVPYAKKCSRCGGFIRMPGLLKMTSEPEGPPDKFAMDIMEAAEKALIEQIRAQHPEVEDEKELVDLEQEDPS